MKYVVSVLGNICSANEQVILSAISAFLGQKGVDNSAVAAQTVCMAIMRSAALKQFKKGAITELAFNSAISELISNRCGVVISEEELNNVWNGVYPQGKLFPSESFDALMRLAEDGNRIILVSLTNPKDMRLLKIQLEANGFLFEETPKNISIRRAGKDGSIEIVASYKRYTTEIDELVSAVLADANQDTVFVAKVGVPQTLDPVLSKHGVQRVDWDGIPEHLEHVISHSPHISGPF